MNNSLQTSRFFIFIFFLFLGGRPSEQPLAPADVHVSKETSKSVVEAHSAGHNHDAPVNVKKKQKSRPQRIGKLLDLSLYIMSIQLHVYVLCIKK